MNENVNVNNQNMPIRHDIPRCNVCGYVGPMKPGPLFRGSDLLWFFLLLFLAGAGFIYLIFILIIRSNPNKREKICPHCGSCDMHTYIY